MYDYQKGGRSPPDGMWVPSMTKDVSSMSFVSCGDVEASDAESYNHHPCYPADLSLLANAASDLSLSQPIFNNTQAPSSLLPEETMVSWSQAMLQTPPQTIAPSATIHEPLCLSPHQSVVPMTPHVGRYTVTQTSTPSAGPHARCAPRSIDRHPNMGEIHTRLFLASRSERRPRRCGSRTGRRIGERKGSKATQGNPKKVTSRSGVVCDLIIEANEHACTHPGCVDKNGKPKSFKRAEHRKRHINTVHSGQRPYKCFVPECKTEAFSRMDNLKSHLEKTHGRRSAAARNSYVATLDKSSEYYDSEYRGPFDNRGFGFFPSSCTAKLG